MSEYTILHEHKKSIIDIHNEWRLFTPDSAISNKLFWTLLHRVDPSTLQGNGLLDGLTYTLSGRTKRPLNGLNPLMLLKASKQLPEHKRAVFRLNVSIPEDERALSITMDESSGQEGSIRLHVQNPRLPELVNWLAGLQAETVQYTHPTLPKSTK